MKLLVQEYLQSGKTLDDLRVEHGVYSHVCNNKVGLSYDMIEASKGDRLAQQCRGLILRDKTYEIVAAPLFRFFNYEETGSLPENFDWNSAVFEEKCDGTLIIIYWDNLDQRWYCATRSRPEADGNIDGSELTFVKLTDITIKTQFNFNNLNEFMNYYFNNAKDYTFCFELTSPYNRIVCKYETPSLTLLAVRHNQSLKEEQPEPWGQGLIPTPKIYSFDNITVLLNTIRSWNPEEYEGVVIKDKNFNRIKVKNPSYVAFNRIRDSLSTSVRGCVEVILLGTDDDIVGMVPELISNRIYKLKGAMQQLFKNVEEDYLKLKDIENMKEFASQAEMCIWPSALYALKRKKAKSLQEFACGGNKFDGKNIPTTALDTIINLCKKIDPTVGEI